MKENKEKPLKYEATLIPSSGAPYIRDVEGDPGGETITAENKTWVIAPDSVTMAGNKRRIILPHDAAESLSASFIKNKPYMTAGLFFRYMKMNLLSQLFNLQNKKPWYKQTSTWVMTTALVFIVLVLVWMTVSLSDGMSGLQQALEGIRIAGSGPGSNGSGGGHNPIAPGS